MTSLKQLNKVFQSKKQFGIEKKMLNLMMVCMAVIILLITTLSCMTADFTTKTAIERLFSETAEIAANTIYTNLNNYMTTLEEFASREYFITEDKSPDKMEEYCNEFTLRNGAELTTYSDANGDTLLGLNIADRDYFIQCKETLSPVISNIIASKVTGDLTINLAAPIIVDNEFAGLIVSQYNANFLSKLTSSIRVGDTGYSYMLDEDGTIIAYDNNELILSEFNVIEEAESNSDLKSLAYIQKKMIAGEHGYSEYKQDGSTLFTSYAPIGINNWSIALVGKSSEFLRTLTSGMIFIVIVSLICVTIISFYIKKRIRSIVTPIVQCSERIGLLSTGDLRTEFPVLSTNDEVSVMSQALQNMMKFLNNIITDVDYMLSEMADGNFNVKSQTYDSYIGDFSSILVSITKVNNKLSETLNQIDMASEQVAMGAMQLAESSSSLAEGATDQAGAVEELTATIFNISELAVESAAQTNESYQQALEYSRKAADSSKTLEELNIAMDNIRVTSNEINNIIAEIETIASQTNLLSLNASIEAARAGEAGRGFAVVANEIGKLATDSAKSATTTRELIERAIHEVEKGNHIAMETIDVLSNIIEGIELIATSAKNVSELSSSQSEAIKQIEQGIEDITNVVQNNSASAQETSATSEELSAQSENLKTLLSQFTLMS